MFLSTIKIGRNVWEKVQYSRQRSERNIKSGFNLVPPVVCCPNLKKGLVVVYTRTYGVSCVHCIRLAHDGGKVFPSSPVV